MASPSVRSTVWRATGGTITKGARPEPILAKTPGILTLDEAYSVKWGARLRLRGREPSWIKGRLRRTGRGRAIGMERPDPRRVCPQ